jgi:hypothetical protein
VGLWLVRRCVAIAEGVKNEKSASQVGAGQAWGCEGCCDGGGGAVVLLLSVS